jgi:hypothetical protein
VRISTLITWAGGAAAGLALILAVGPNVSTPVAIAAYALGIVCLLLVTFAILLRGWSQISTRLTRPGLALGEPYLRQRQITRSVQARQKAPAAWAATLPIITASGTAVALGSNTFVGDRDAERLSAPGFDAETADFVYIPVKNTSRDAVAKETSADLSFTSNTAKPFAFRARWAESPERREVARRSDVPDAIDIPPDSARTLDVAWKRVTEADAHGFNNDVADAHLMSWSDPSLVMPAGKYAVHVVVRSKNAGRVEGWVSVEHGGQGQRPTVKLLPKGRPKSLT